MPLWLAETLVAAITVYVIVGLTFAVVFVLVGVRRLDPAARQGVTVGFRLCILPGSAALWPLLAWRWIARSPAPSERNAHRDAAGEHS